MSKPLTDRQKQIYDMSRAVSEGGRGMKNQEIAAELGLAVVTVSQTLVTAYRKLGLPRAPGRRPVEETNPPKAAAIIDAMTDPLKKVSVALEEAGLPGAVGQSVLKRLRTKYFGAVMEVKALKTQEIVRTIEEKLDMIRFYLDDKVMAEASARDLMLGMGVLVEKRALLRGEPTQIISDLERKKLHELLPAFIEEARRRGVTVQGQVLEKTVGPV